MDTDPVVGPLAEQLLGEIETRIVGTQYYDVTILWWPSSTRRSVKKAHIPL